MSTFALSGSENLTLRDNVTGVNHFLLRPQRRIPCSCKSAWFAATSAETGGVKVGVTVEVLVGKTALAKVSEMKETRYFWISWTSEAVLVSFSLSDARRLATVLSNCLLLYPLPFLLALDL